MTITPRMVVLALIAAATLLVLSLTALGANLAAQQAVEMRDRNNATSTPTPTGTPAPVPVEATDDDIIEVFESRFESVRLLSGGTSPIVFITVPSEDPTEISDIINDAVSSLIVTGDFSEITLLLEYDDKIFDATEVSKLVYRSTSVENQLIIALD